MKRGRSSANRPARRGSVLVIVLVVIVLLALTAYNYNQVMLTETEAAVQHQSEVQARHLADSAAEYVATLLANRAEPGLENLQQNPSLFQGVVVAPSERARANGRFTIIAPLEQDPTATRIRYGLIDESSKLNLNVLDKMQIDDAQARTWLMGLPSMTEEIADAIRDWIDSDDNIREYGAESEYYATLNPQYNAKNGPIETIDELLLVRGVTPELLYGEDANRNGLLDPNENDADASPPLDNGDGFLQLGWSSFLTISSAEANIRADGQEKIDLNNGLLTDLYDQLEPEFGQEVADFVIGFRIAGMKDKPPEGWVGPGVTSTSTTDAQGQQQQQNAAQGVASAIAGAAMSPGGQVSRNGIDLSKGGLNRINSFWDLIDSTTNKVPRVDGGTQEEIPSPWSTKGGSLSAELPKLVDALTISGDLFLEGRININQARREVLLGLPGMPEDLVDKIIAAQATSGDGTPDPSLMLSRSSTGWLLFEGLVTDVWTMRALDPYITTRGDVYRAQILGFFDGGGPVARTEVVINSTKQPPQITFFRDLQDLGRGYTRAHLLPIMGQ